MVRYLFALTALFGLVTLCANSSLYAQSKPLTGKPAATPPKSGAAPATPAKPVIQQTKAEAPAQPANPALDKILEDWYASSKNIKKLEGEHIRFVYEYTFGTVKQAEGEFYYEAPDKGRIDLSGTKVKDGSEVDKASAIDGKPLKFKVQSDTPERWVCDGKQVLQIFDAKKEVMQFSIPPEGQGQNIMDGPLPFLFGMPPEKAHQRYLLRLIKQTPQTCVIQALPKWQQDAANYKWAVIMLEPKTMLVQAVQMIDPAETTETVYTFPKITKNPSKPLSAFLRIPGSDPFKPNLKGYKFLTAGDGEQVAATKPSEAPKAAGDALPSVVGLEHSKAKDILEKKGYQVQFFKGDPANTPQLSYHVYRQIPEAKQALKKGEVVKLVVYTEPQIALTEGKQDGAAATGLVPKVIGLGHSEAKQKLEKAGYKVKMIRGDLARTEDDLHTVQDQAPRAGTKLDAEGTVTLKLFIDAQDASGSKAE